MNVVNRVLSLINSTLSSERPSLSMLSWTESLSEMMLSNEAAPGRAKLFISMPYDLPIVIPRRLKVYGRVDGPRKVSGFFEASSEAMQCRLKARLQLRCRGINLLDTADQSILLSPSSYKNNSCQLEATNYETPHHLFDRSRNLRCTTYPKTRP